MEACELNKPKPTWYEELRKKTLKKLKKGKATEEMKWWEKCEQIRYLSEMLKLRFL